MKILVNKVLDVFHKSILFISDGLIVIFSFWVGYQMWLISPNRIQQSPPAFDFNHVLLFIFLFNGILIWTGTYRIQSSVTHVVRLKNLIRSSIIGFTVALIIGFFTRSLLVGRLQALYTFIIIIPAVIIERGIIDILWSKLIAEYFFHKRVVIFGAGDTGKRLFKVIQKHAKLGYEAIGFFDDQKLSNSIVMANPLPVMGGKEDFYTFLDKRSDEIDEVLIAMPSATTEEVMQVMGLCDEFHLPYKFVPSFNDLAFHRLNQENIDGIPLFSQKELSISIWNRVCKRVCDLVLTVIILIITAPLFGLFALLIKRDSEGPVIFKQKRVGLDGREFMFYKFRTMRVDTPRYAIHPQDRDDPRINRIGQYLRRTSLDELPQFWNVLKGDMSIVGPRPEMPFIVETYTEMHRERLKVKPGITGIWQISGDRSLPIHENIDHDLYYIENQSPLLDIVIILQTIWFAVVRGVGAK